MRTLFTLAAVVTLSACGGGGSDAGTPALVDPVACAYTVTVGLYGDSTMHSNGIATQTMQSEFDRMFGPGRVVVSNYGIPGAKAVDVAPVMKPTLFHVTTANFALNDCNQDVTIPAFRSALRTMIASGISTLETPNVATFKNCAAYADAVVDEAFKAGIPLVETEAFTASDAARLADGVHPTPDLYRDIAKYRAETLAPLVRSHFCQKEF